MLRLLVTIFSLCLLAVQISGYSIDVAEKKLIKVAPDVPTAKCDVAELFNEPNVKNFVCKEEGQYTSQGSTCDVSIDVGDYTHVETVLCEYGHWKTTETMKSRQKRFFWVFAAIAAVTAVAVGCLIFCSSGGGGGGGRTLSPPKFPSPCRPTDLPDVIIVPTGQTSVQVTWTEPTATDTDSSNVVVKQLSTPQRGDYFQGSVYDNGYNHNVVYDATDPDGLRDTCVFSFRVQVLTCFAPAYLSNGRRTCSHGSTFIRGSTCTHECNQGYERIGPETTTCEGDTSPTWSETTECQPISCSPPADLENGRVSCLDAGNTYQSICAFHCNIGYRLVGDTFIRCTADGSWTPSVVVCEDDTPPTLSCVTPQIFYADAKTTSTAVTWTLPIATDLVDADPDVTRLEGPALGAVISGTSYVTYTAVDEAGNTAPTCIIELRVQQIKCTHPLDAFKDPHIRFTCDDNSYAYGTECEASCILNLPLAGTNLVTCEKRLTSAGSPEGYWSSGTGAKPYCEQISCPRLDPPVNGALVYDTVSLRPVYTMLCNENYTITSYLVKDDIVVNFNGLFTCTDSGKWLPIDYAPGCTVPRRPGRIGLLSEMLYYSGDCTDEITQEEIRAIFQDILANVTELYQTLCPSGESCAATDPTIVCGTLNNKKKREVNEDSDVEGYYATTHDLSKRQTATTFYTLVKFVIEVAWDPPAGMSIDDAYVYYDGIHATLKTATQAKVADGWFVMDNAPISMTQPDDSFTTESYGNLMCEDGYRLDGVFCKPCPTGHFMNGSNCARCPLGSYSAEEGATTCTPCDQGFSTKDVGSNSSSQCVPLCLPGTFSPDGLKDCTACPMSTYQPSPGQTICALCPANTYTETDGSTSLDQCLAFDVYIGSSQGVLTLYEPADITLDFSLALWIKPLSSSSRVIVQLASADGPTLTMTVSGNIELNIRETLTTVNTSLDTNIWNHVALLLNFTSNSVSVSINGNPVIALSTAFEPVIITSLEGVQGTLTLANTGSSGIYVSGLHIQAAILTPSDIQSHLSSCHVNSGNDVVGMDVFKTQSVPGVTINVPSVCDATNECASSPCGSHICINEIGGYSCVCYGGFTGTNCETPPNYCIGNECKNGATCISELDGYNCTCLLGYTGEFCEYEPVDGQWSLWSAWTVCNQTCDGTMTRSRLCDNPAPGPGGAHCTGNQIELEPCNGACPTCPSLNRLSGTRKQCSTDTETGNQVCTVSCLDGYQFPPGLNGSREIYTCGPGTGYKWTPKQTTLACVTGHQPTRYSLSTSVQYDQGIPSSANTDVTSNVESRLSSTPCFNMGTCSVAVEVTNSRKRSTGSTLTIIFSVSLQESGDLDLPSVSQNGTVSASLQEVIDAINNLEDTATYIEDNANALFDVTVAGISYTVDSTSLQVQATIDCSSGQTADSGVCVACPEGTYLDGSSCRLCGKGFYQSSPGQTSCVQCPSGYTTSSIGSAYSTQCSVESDSTEEKTLPIPTSDDNNIAAIAIGISCAAIFVSVASAVGLVFYLKKRGKNNKRVSSEVNLQSRNIAPANTYFIPTDSKRPGSAISLSRDFSFTFSLPPPYEEGENMRNKKLEQEQIQ